MVISLLGVTIMHHVLLFYKVVNRRERQHQDFYQMEYLARQLAETKFDHSDCMLYADQANTVIVKLKSNKGCTVQIKGIKYYYLIEELGDFPCMIAVKNEKHYSTHHRRVSLMLVSQDSPNSLLQIRYFIAIPLQSCYGTRYDVSLGLNSWRYMSSI